MRDGKMFWLHDCSLILGCSIVLAAAIVPSRAKAQNQTDTVKATGGAFVRSFLDSHCVRCHGEKKA